MNDFERAVPKFKKTKSAAFKWGQQYYTALRDAVFPVKHNFYTTPEIPRTLRENNNSNKGQFVCFQCGDSFHFQSSLDDHNARYSWILGYWCRHCTKLQCTHQKNSNPQTPSTETTCINCKNELKKRCAYFKARGLTPGQNVGKILIFYNQCQFFGHLKEHGIGMVDMCDMMLMPIPMTIQSDEYAQLDTVCKTLFECMFIKSIHIMDWLRLENINFKWWTAKDTDDNPVGKLLQQYEVHIVKANRLTKTIKDEDLIAINKCTDDEDINDPDNDHDKSVEIIEMSDNHCDLNEIEFVDCASLDETIQTTEVETTTSTATSLSNSQKITGMPSVGSQPLKSKDLFKIINKPSAMLTNMSDINKNSFTQLVNRNIKISTSNSLQSTNLPKNNINNNNNNVNNNNSSSNSNKGQQIIIINQNKDDKNNEVKTNLQCVLANSKQDGGTKKVFTQTADGRLVLQPGAKVILKQLTKPMNSFKNDGETKLNVPKFNIVKNKLKILPANSISKTLVTSSHQILKSGSTFTTVAPSASVSTAAGSGVGAVTTKQTVLQIRDHTGLKTISVAPEKCAKLIPMEALHKSKEVLQKEMENLQKQNSFPGQNRNKSLINYRMQASTAQTIQISQSTQKSVQTAPTTAQRLQTVPKTMLTTQKPMTSFLKPLQTYQKLQTVPKLVQNTQSPAQNIKTYQKSLQTYQKSNKNVQTTAEKLLKPIESLLKPTEVQNSQDTFKKIKLPDKSDFNKPEDDVPILLSIRDGDTWVDSNQVQKADGKGANLLKRCPPEKKQTVVRKYREAMIQSFHQYRKRVLPLIADIRKTNEYYAKTNVDVHSVITVNEIALRNFEKFLDNDRNVKMTDDDKINEEFHFHTVNWEKKNSQAETQYCDRCHLKLRPKDYLIGLSKPSNCESNYCQCYNFICHLCNARQGTAARYNIHMSFHRKESPYICPECFKSFSSIQNLELHIWQQCFHIKTQQSWSCNVCEVEGFLTIEQLTSHYYKIHAKSAVSCNPCRKIFDSYSEYRVHNSEVHHSLSTFETTDRLIKCDFGDCLTKPESFYSHVAAHVTVDRITHYTCPFCTFSMGEISINRHLIQDHVFSVHLERLKEVITHDSLKVFLKMNLVSQASVFKPIVPATTDIKIVNAFPITSKCFDQQINHNAQLVDNDVTITDNSNNTDTNDSVMPIKIVDVRTEKVDEPVNEKLDEDVTEIPHSSLKIINVTSISDKLSDFNNSEDDNNDKGNEMISSSIEKLSKLGVSLIEIKKNDKQKKTDDAVNVRNSNEVSIINNYSKLQRRSSPPPLVLINNVNLLELEKETQSEKERDKKNYNDDIEIECIKDNRIVPKNNLFNFDQVSIQKKPYRRVQCRLAMNGPNFKKEIIHYKCHLCDELINTSWFVVNDHFRECHFSDYKIVSVTPKLRRLTEMDIIKYTGRKRKSDLMMTPKKRKRGNFGNGNFYNTCKKISFDKFEGNNLGICVTQESLQDTEGNFKCKKCNCLFKDINVLREHVASNHRIRGHYLVCLECGDNFIVAPSLQMHLKAFHGIADPIKYLAQNTAYAPDVLDEIEEQDKITESNQCYVCYAVFESKPAVDKHLRVHGMAFLNRKRIEARNALKSPEKYKSNDKSPSNEINDDKVKKKIEIKTDNDDDNANVRIFRKFI
ncbi:uncharacterized protein LOC103573641 [Microplitis demolitor]|uniref:uncharacterized protein LOC103573641 n=1 Tax=Microplitis demolitor TaxID=69319 RepID=UPI0004CD59F7|nr:uncharacterized protein LOC103573641 [Microplitis demolitor]XP_014300209.2 uncharacterized protein LOC103573641 [Microplitis demolitor]XP_053597761.1 uncharacterized protein LOC103573641 [Microplitis demolitor]XP_053597762.1 uncharacterized protein LOC103573641 [Microplitis demolitor]